MLWTLSLIAAAQSADANELRTNLDRLVRRVPGSNPVSSTSVETGGGSPSSTRVGTEFWARPRFPRPRAYPEQEDESMLLWSLSLASAVNFEDVADQLDDARDQLAVCARSGCERADGARAAFVASVGTYLRDGRADGTLAATVRELDGALFAKLPDVVRDAATAPQEWVGRVGGVAPTGASPEDRVARSMQARLDHTPRVFVLDDPDRRRRLGDDKTDFFLQASTGLLDPMTRLYPASDLCQQADAAVLVGDEPGVGSGAVMDLMFRGSFSISGFAETYDLRVDGVRVVPTDWSELPVEPGRHQVHIVRDDGVGAVMVYDLTEGQTVHPRDDAQRCIAQAIEDPEQLAVHFERLQARLPDAPLLVADIRDGNWKEPIMWHWKDGAVVRVTR